MTRDSVGRINMLIGIRGVVCMAVGMAAQLWVTKYRPDKLYAGGDYPNQSAGGEGLPKYVAGRAPAVNTDLVFWYTVGFRHVPRAEDWPVMPTLFTGFIIRPQNFFDGSPALDVPPTFKPR